MSEVEITIKEENSVLKFMKQWQDRINSDNTLVVVSDDNDIPEDIKEDVLRIRQNLTDAGVDVSSMYLIDYYIGGIALAAPATDGKVTLYFKYDFENSVV